MSILAVCLGAKSSGPAAQRRRWRHRRVGVSRPRAAGILLAAVVLAAGILAACGDDGGSGSLAGQLVSRADRPDLGPGESNAPDKGLSILALATSDLTVLAPAQVVDTLVGSGPDAPVISNVSFTGALTAGGTFTGGGGIGFEDGVVLSSGLIASVPGPNVADNTSSSYGLPGDDNLDRLIPGFDTLDAALLEFDLQCPDQDAASFRYVFSSEEYNEFANTNFNDVFGFFVNGANVALLPDGVTPVSINNVNGGNPENGTGPVNPAFYINNDRSDGGGFIDTEMDGLTVVLTAIAPLHAGANHMKLAVADAGDEVLDSNVFLERGSLLCGSPEPPNQTPVASAGPDQSFECLLPAEVVSVTLDGSGSSDPDGDSLSFSWSEGGAEIATGVSPTVDFGAGTHVISLFVSDGQLSSAPDDVSISLLADVEPPEITVLGDDPLTTPCAAEYIDPGATAQDACSGDLTAAIDVTSDVDTGTPGTYAVTYQVSDAAGLSASATRTVVVAPGDPPIVEVVPPIEIWPPNHQVRDFSLSDCIASISTTCGGAPDPDTAGQIVSITSDEPEDAGGDGHTRDDISITGPRTFSLRSERLDSSDGRVYSIHFVVTDATGNATSATCLVTVPLDPSGLTAVDSGPAYEVTP
jgi:hypothetical protein